MEERCILCGNVIPEGRQVCPVCEKQYSTETTRIITMRVTLIGDSKRFETKEDTATFYQEFFKYALNADDVVVEKIQDFIMNKDGE